MTREQQLSAYLNIINGMSPDDGDIIVVRNHSPGAGLVPVHPEDEASIKALYLAHVSLSDIARKMYFKPAVLNLIVDRMVRLGRIPPRSKHQRYRPSKAVYKTVSVEVSL